VAFQILVLCSQDRCGLRRASSIIKTGLERSGFLANADIGDGNTIRNQWSLGAFDKVSLYRILLLKKVRSRGSLRYHRRDFSMHL
jgi:hypothetical protein